MVERINSVGETRWGCSVCEVLAINRFIYASSVMQPSTSLLGSDSEYSSIKRSSGTHARADDNFVNHMLMYSQSQRLSQEKSEHEARHKCKSCKAGEEWRWMPSKHCSLHLKVVLKLMSWNNLTDMQREWNTQISGLRFLCTEKLLLVVERHFLFGRAAVFILCVADLRFPCTQEKPSLDGATSQPPAEART